MMRFVLFFSLVLAAATSTGQHPGLIPTLFRWDTTGAAGVLQIEVMNPGSVPAYISGYTNLRHLRIYGNDWDYEFRSLPKEVCSLKKLQSLLITNTNLDALPADIWTMPGLEVLDVSSNKVCNLPSPSGSTPLRVITVSQELDSLPEFPKLEKISYWVYQPNGYRFAGLGKVRSVKQVGVYGTGTNSQAMDNLLAQVRMIPGLHTLDLGEMIPTESHLNTLSTISSLKTLRFSVFTAPPDVLAYFTALDTLHIHSIATNDKKERQQVFEEMFSMGLNDLRLDFRPEDTPSLRLMPNLSLNITDEKHLHGENMNLLASLDGLRNITLPESRWLPDSIIKLVRLRNLDMSRVIPDDGTRPLAEHVFVLISKIPLLESVRIHWSWLEEKPSRIARISHLKQVVVVGAPYFEDANSPGCLFRKEVIKHCPAAIFQSY